MEDMLSTIKLIRFGHSPMSHIWLPPRTSKCTKRVYGKRPNISQRTFHTVSTLSFSELSRQSDSDVHLQRLRHKVTLVHRYHLSVSVTQVEPEKEFLSFRSDT